MKPPVVTVRVRGWISPSLATLYRLSAERGAGASDLKVTCIGARRVFRRDALDRYLTAHTA